MLLLGHELICHLSSCFSKEEEKVSLFLGACSCVCVCIFNEKLMGSGLSSECAALTS